MIQLCSQAELLAEKGAVLRRFKNIDAYHIISSHSATGLQPAQHGRRKGLFKLVVVTNLCQDTRPGLTRR